MIERLVDVVDKNGCPVLTYPITLSRTAPDADFEAKSLEAAMYGHLVPTIELASLTTRMHVSRGGRLEPYGDEVSCLSQTKEHLHGQVSVEAYRLWMSNGKPTGRLDEFWRTAHERLLRTRAYTLWQQKGSPADRADEFWFKTIEFEQP